MHTNAKEPPKCYIIHLMYLFNLICFVPSSLLLLFVCQLILRACLEHPHHTLFIILALVNANKDESFTSRSRLARSSQQQPSPLDLVGPPSALSFCPSWRGLILCLNPSHGLGRAGPTGSPQLPQDRVGLMDRDITFFVVVCLRIGSGE